MSGQLVLTAKTIPSPAARAVSRPSGADSRITRTGMTLKDRALFTSLVRAHKAQTVAILVRAARLNQPGSPLWDPIDNIAPLLSILLVAALVAAVVNVLAAAAVMVLGILLYAILIRPFILRVVQDRAIESAVGHLHNWELLWKQGGLILKTAAANGAVCLSPAGDWRAFVQQNIAMVALDGTDSHISFQAARDSAERSVLAEANF
jgi:hypothetical protein